VVEENEEENEGKLAAGAAKGMVEVLEGYREDGIVDVLEGYAEEE
jgi:hypothetical protein